MGSRVINLSRGVRTVTPDGLVSVDDAIDVLGSSSARLVLKLVGVDNPDSPQFSIAIQTAMDLKDPEGATVAGIFIFTEGKGVVMAQTFTGLLRYIWWTAGEFDPAEADAFHFSLEGVAYD